MFGGERPFGSHSDYAQEAHARTSFSLSRIGPVYVAVRTKTESGFCGLASPATDDRACNWLTSDIRSSGWRPSTGLDFPGTGGIGPTTGQHRAAGPICRPGPVNGIT